MVRAGSVAIVLAAVVSALSARVGAPAWSGHVPEPFETSLSLALVLEKDRFLQAERIFLWMSTQRAPDERRPISQGQLDDARVTYTRPDGTVRIDRPSAPIDGHGIRAPMDMGFRGGWTLGEFPQLGRWSVVYEMGSERSAPATFTVEAPAPLEDIAAHFEFSTPAVHRPDASAILVVRNRTDQTLRFVELGQNHSILWGGWQRGERSTSISVPQSAVAAATGNKRLPMSVDRLDWDSIRRIPHVVVAPGATWRLTIPLSPWLGRQVEGDWGRVGDEFRLSTELQILIGQPGGEWSGFSPVRLNARGTTKRER